MTQRKMRHRKGELYPRCCMNCHIPKAWMDFPPRPSNERIRLAWCKKCQSDNAHAIRRRLDAELGSMRRVTPRDAAATIRRSHRYSESTLPTASNRGKVWTGAELQVADDRSRTAVEVATVLHRSYWAVVNVRHKIDGGDPRTLYLLGRAGGYAEA